jgi:hypothetical protein
MKVLSVVLLLCTLSLAQEQVLLANPSPQNQTRVSPQLTASIKPNLHPSPAAGTSFEPTIGQPRSGSVLKSPSYLLLLAAATTATIADCETTKAQLSDPNAREGDPIFGSRPSRARLYGISLPLLGLNAFVSAKLKSRHSRAWPVLFGVMTGAHGAAAIHNGLQ